MLWHGNDVPQWFVLFISFACPNLPLPSPFSFEDDHASLTERHWQPSHLISSYCFAPSHAHTTSLGLALGGVWGLREGARKPLAVSNARLRINSILNSVTRRGTFIGNSAGCLGTLLRPFDVSRLLTSPPSPRLQCFQFRHRPLPRSARHLRQYGCWRTNRRLV